MRIQYGAHTCKILDNLNSEQEEQIRELMAYEPKEASFNPRLKGRARFVKIDPRRYLYNKRTKEFPTGLLPTVQSHYDVELVAQNELEPARPWHIEGVKPRHYQEAAFQVLSGSGRGVAILPTGTGKTCGCAMIASGYPDKRILITTPNKRLLHQNRLEVSKFLRADVGILGDSEQDLQPRVVVSTIQSLCSRIEAKDTAVLAFLKEVGVWICDECHGAAADSYRMLSRELLNAHNRFGMTATWLREDGCELVMEGVLGPAIYNYSYDQAFSEGFLTPIRVWMREFDHDYDRPKRKPLFTSHYKTRIVENDARNLQVAMDAAALVNMGLTPCLVMVRQIEHGKRLAEMLNCPFVNGEHQTKAVDQLLEEFCAGVHPVIVASGILNVGVNLRELRSAVNAAGGDSRVDCLQKPGRGLRLFEDKEFFDYVDYFDKDPVFFREHSMNRRMTYKMNFPGRVIEIAHDKALQHAIRDGKKPVRFMDDF